MKIQIKVKMEVRWTWMFAASPGRLSTPKTMDFLVFLISVFSLCLQTSSLPQGVYAPGWSWQPSTQSSLLPSYPGSNNMPSGSVYNPYNPYQPYPPYPQPQIPPSPSPTRPTFQINPTSIPITPTNLTYEAPDLGAALANLLRAKAEVVRSAVLGGIHTVASLPRAILDVLWSVASPRTPEEYSSANTWSRPTT